ncbi:uncharacterized protein CC84DRAFT_1258720 [Paraphaeosphaeria sporulosa]|uniref:Uncharacterized protein n=1 Tax=Paraphaeosphaeria sporulosa TaxID=1460663 RepID=A0A177CLM0_9PLEO|nr:uncharacterized protein CC84DRAFT_1258720 [Paraphaeosphaeria sporulosa]OAG07677.1 hypothetical protein CC84DRAFT_1258720 [Paraphaeosphaeria sporulosa]
MNAPSATTPPRQRSTKSSTQQSTSSAWATISTALGSATPPCPTSSTLPKSPPSSRPTPRSWNSFGIPKGIQDERSNLQRLRRICIDVVEKKRPAEVYDGLRDQRIHVPAPVAYDFLTMMMITEGRDMPPIKLSIYHYHDEDATYCACKRRRYDAEFLVEE